MIHGRSIATRCEDIVDMKETNVSVESLNKSFQIVYFLIEFFWRRWYEEYLTDHREQQQIICRTKNI